MMDNTINGRTPEEIKRGLECCSVDGLSCSNCSYCVSCDADIHALERDALAYIQQLKSAQPKWISVEERLPERCETVLGAFLRYDGYEINITKYCVYPNRNVWFIGDMNAVGGTPTHWMPLPEAPKEG